jgi:uncharacterized damage-inducible protein DinB
MTLGAGMIPEMDQEFANTRRVLERVPESRFAWRPHAKSYTMGALATHVATLPSWGPYTMDRDELDVAPVGQPPMRAEEVRTTAELVARFDTHAAAARASIGGASDDRMLGPWTLLAGGNKVFTMPRIAVLRSFVMNHLIHHRAQLGVYLRLCDVPVPALYGPTADESST